MPLWQFSLLAAAVTVAGISVVVLAARHARRMAPTRTRFVGLACLVGYLLVLTLRPPAWPLIDLAVLVGGVGGTLLIERGLRTPGAVAAFLTVAATIDVISISGGPTRALIDGYRDGSSDLLLYLTLVVPLDGRTVPIVGIGDLLVGGAAAVALMRQGVGPRAVMGAIVAGLLAALAYGLWRGGAPALPFIAAAVLVLVWRRSVVARPGPGAAS